MRFFEKYNNYALLYEGNGTYSVLVIEENDGYPVRHRFNVGHDNRPHRMIFAEIRRAIEMALETPRVYTVKAMQMAADILGCNYKSELETRGGRQIRMRLQF